MRKNFVRLLTCLLATIVAFFGPARSAGANVQDIKPQLAQTVAIVPELASGYQIDDYKSTISINKDTTISVTETLTVNFFEAKHGIYRYLPTNYSTKTRTINSNVDVLSVADEKGNSYNYTVSRSPGQLQIKIGDANKTLTGLHTYVISYNASDVIQQYENHDELYWNVTGSRWDARILSAQAVAHSDYADIDNVDCFAGTFGSNDKYCIFDISTNSASFDSTTTLGPGKDMTIVLVLSKDNNLQFPGVLERVLKTIFDNWGYLLSVAPVLFIFTQWRKKGRDSAYKSDNVYYKPEKTAVQTVSFFRRRFLPMVYHPIDGLSPSEVGTIIDERVDINDVVAEMVELARLDFFEIRKIEIKKLIGHDTDYAFVKKENYIDENVAKLKDYQRYLLKEIFRSDIVHDSVSTAEDYFKDKGSKLDETRKALIKKNYVLLSAMKKRFYKRLPIFREKLYKRMSDEGFFEADPEKVRVKWIVITVAIQIVVLGLIMLFTFITFNPGPIILAVLFVVPTIVFAYSMPKRTAKGYSLYRQIKGLKYFVSKGKWRYEVNEKNLFLEEMLPLAISLGVVSKLTKDMEELGIDKPSYIVGSGWSSFSSDLASFQSFSASAMTITPSSSGRSSWSGGSGFSGGGFSGGGFGGGGGGSW